MPSTVQQCRITVVGREGCTAGLDDVRDALDRGVGLSTTTPDGIDGQFAETDCLVIDQEAIEGSGQSVIDRAEKRSSDLPVVVLLPGDEASGAGTVGIGATDYLSRDLCETRPTVAAAHLERLADGSEGPTDGTAEESLLPADDRFELITESVDEVIYIANADFSEVAFVSDAYEDIWGRPVTDLYENATAFIEGIDPRDREAFERDFEAMRADIRAGDPDDQYEFEFRVRQPDGDIRWVSASGYPVETDAGEGRYVGIAEDITERKEAETRFQTIVERIDAGVMLVPEGETEPAYLNPVYEDLTGIPVEELYDPDRFVEHIHPEDREGYIADVGAMAEDIMSGDPRDQYEFEFRFQRPDGETRWFHWTGYPLVDEDHGYWYVGLTTDVTERRARQERIRENERTFREIFNKSSAAITVHDPETKEMVAVNDTMCELLGYDRETVLDRDIEGVSVTEQGYTQDRGAEIIDRVMTSGEPEEFEWVIEDADGERHVMLVTGTPATINGEDRLLATSQEITERKRREQALEEEREKYSTLVEQSTDGVAVIRDGEYVFVNEQFASITGYDEADLLGRPFHTVFADEYSDLVKQRYERRIAGDSPPSQYDVEAVDADGTRRTLELSVSRIRHEGEPATLANFRDVTERRRRERTLESFHDATAELTTAETAAEAGRIAVAAAADVFDLPATAVYRYDEATGALDPTATGPDGPSVEDLPRLTADASAVWEAFISETMRRLDPADSGIPDTNGEQAVVFPLGGNGILIVWQVGETFDADAASIFAATLEAALNRLRGERRLESRRAELEAESERARRMESLTEVTRRVDAAITTHSSRQGIRDAVCSELIEVDPFAAAWIAGAEVGTDRLTPRTVAGIDRDRVEQVLGGDGSTAARSHPVLDAWTSGDPRTVNDLLASGRDHEWQRRLLREGLGALCAVPVAYRGITYGVLAVAAEESGAFGDREIEVLSQLGTSVGYAMAALERQRALESDDTLELEFQGTGVDLPFARLARETGCTVSHERTVRRQDGSVSVYYSLTGRLPADVEEPAASVLPGEIRTVSRESDTAIVERRGSSWFGAVVSEYGGVLRRGHADADGVTLVVELPQDADTRTIVERLQSEFAGLELVAQRQHQDRAVTPTEMRDRLEERLSDRQLEALRTAYEMGYFNWPRESSGEDVADRLGITQPTVNKHIRVGERKVFRLLFESGTVGDGPK